MTTSCEEFLILSTTSLNNFGSLEKYYNIGDKRLTIKFLQVDNHSIRFDIKFTRSPQAILLNKKISKYLLIEVANFAKEEINISMFVKYTHDFPFTPPRWLLLEYHDNILNNNISKYYEYITHQHNEIYHKFHQWYPAISLRTDFLDIFTKFLKGIKYTIDEKQIL